MSSNTAGGVRNLRAMFENKDTLSTSPPSRGRSPANSDASANSRPVSKVRANFVAVERPGEAGQSGQQWGLRKASDVSSMADVKENGMGTDGAVGQEQESDMSVIPAKEASETHQRHASKNSLDGGLGTILKGSAFEPSTPAKMVEDDRKKSPEKTSGLPKINGTVPNVSGRMVDKMNQAKDSGKPNPPPTTKLNTTKTAQPIKPPPTRQIQPPKVSTKSPILPKPPKTPTTPVSVSKDSPKVRQSSTSTSVKPSSPRISRPTGPGVSVPTRKVEEKDTRPNGEKKTLPVSPRLTTRPRSPPKAVRRPDPMAAMADTKPAANGTNLKSPVEDKAPALKKHSRPTTTTRLPTTTTSSLTKKPSRASLPAHTLGERATSRVSTASKPADESFLARMMRPTTSTAQKAHEKVQVNSPPRSNRNTSGRTPSMGRRSMGSMKAETEDKENEKEGQGQDFSPAEKTDAGAPPQQAQQVA